MRLHEVFRVVLGVRGGVDDEVSSGVDVGLERDVRLLILVFLGVAVAMPDVDADEDAVLFAGSRAEVCDSLVDVVGILPGEAEQPFEAGT